MFHVKQVGWIRPVFHVKQIMLIDACCGRFVQDISCRESVRTVILQP